MKEADRDIQERVDRLFDRFERMTDAEFALLRSVWEEQDGSAREAAWKTVKATLRTRHGDSMLNDARDRIAAWVNNYPAAMVIGDVPASFQGSGMDFGSIRKAAIPPMLDAIAATIASDRLSAAELTLLMEPISTLAPHKTTK